MTHKKEIYLISKDKSLEQKLDRRLNIYRCVKDMCSDFYNVSDQRINTWHKIVLSKLMDLFTRHLHNMER